MAISKYTLYKYVKVAGSWRYCKVAYHDNSKIKPDFVFVNVKQGLLEKHPEGRYYMNHNGMWIDAGTDALEAPTQAQAAVQDVLSAIGSGVIHPHIWRTFSLHEVAAAHTALESGVSQGSIVLNP